MARVKPEEREAVTKSIDELPPDMLNKCGLCNRTLYDHLVSIQAQTGAPQKTVCDLFATKYNEERAEHDHVSGQAFLERIKWIDKVNKRELSGKATKYREKGIDESLGRQQVHGDCDLCGDSHQISQETVDDLSAESQQISDEGNTLPVSDEPVDEVCEAQDTNAGGQESEEPVETVSSEPSPDTSSKPDPYEALVEFWRTEQYTVEDVYEVFLTELLKRFSPGDVEKYRQNGDVQLDDLSMVVGKTVNQADNLSPEDLHRILRAGLNAYGRWSEKRIDSAIGTAPLAPEQTAPWDF